MANGKFYRFLVLPFGVSSAPMILTKALKSTVKKIREAGIRINIYLDDILIMAQTQQQLRAHMTTTIQQLNQDGWRINFKKSTLDPSQSIDYIGAHIISNPHVQMSLIQESYDKLRSALHLLLKFKNPSTFLLRKTLGSINWALCFQTRFKILKTNLQNQLHEALARKWRFTHLNTQSTYDINRLLQIPLSEFSSTVTASSV
jgi:hypothetical protein